MRHRFLIGIVTCILTTLHVGCMRQKPVSAQMPSEINTQPPVTASLSEYIRTVLRVSSENTSENQKALAQLHQEKPELAEVAAYVGSNPGNLEAMSILAQAYLEEGFYVNSLQLFQEIQLHSPGDIGANLGLALIWDAWKDYGLALQYASRAVSFDPTSSEALETLGRVYLHRNENDFALHTFLAALEFNPDKATLLANTGYLYMMKGDWEDARHHLARAIEIDGSMVESRNHLGIVLARLGDHDGALEHFMAANEPAAAFNNLGATYMGLMNWNEAQKAFRQALAIDPTYSKAEKNLREVELHLPPPANYTISPFITGAAAPAVDRQSPKYDPVYPLSLGEYTRNLFKIQTLNADAARLAQLQVKNPDFVELIRRVNSKIPPGTIATANSLDARRQISLPLVLMEDPLAPIQRLEIPAITGSAEPTKTVAQSSVDMENELLQVLPEFVKARSSDGEEDAWALARAGQEHLERGNWEQARTSLAQALEIDEGIPEARNNLGVALAQLGDSNGALKQFLTVSPPAEAHHHLGLVYASQKKWREASEELKSAVKIDPAYEEARAELRKVETHLPPPAIYAIQVFSVRNEQRARSAGAELAEKAGLKVSIERADLNEKGVWYRARFHGYTSFNAALKAAKTLILNGFIKQYWIAPVQN